jgi:hypothetical protein
MCKSTIKCPFCQSTYLPGEIFMPTALVGQPTDVVRDSFGKLLYHDYESGKAPDYKETYICDYCNKLFVVEAELSFKTHEEEPAKNFENPYVSLLD